MIGFGTIRNTTYEAEAGELPYEDMKKSEASSLVSNLQKTKKYPDIHNFDNEKVLLNSSLKTFHWCKEQWK